MKKSILARGFIGSVASLLGVVAMGCSGEVMDEATAGNGEIGSVEQAIGIAINETSPIESAFPAYVKLSSGDMLVVGGYDDTGAAIRSIRKVAYDPTANPDTAVWSQFLDGSSQEILLNVARGEAEIAEIPGQAGKYLVLGGKSNEGTNSQLASAEIIDTTASPITVTLVTDTLASSRVNFTLTQCGSKLLVAGGQSSAPAVVSTLEVFTYNATHANSTFETMRNAANNATVITMNGARRFHGALSMSSTKVILMGGDDGTNLLDSTEVLTVDANCALNVGNGATNKPVVGGAMPDVRNKFAAAVRTVVSGGNTREAIVAGGDDGSVSGPLSVYLFEDSNNTWSTHSDSLDNPHVRPIVALDGPAGDFALIGGLIGNVVGGTRNDVTTVEVEVFDDATDTFANHASNLDSNGRIGSWAGYLDNTDFIVGQGRDRVHAGGGVYTQTWLLTAE